MIGRRHIEHAVDGQRCRLEEPARERTWAQTKRNRLRYRTGGNRPLRVRVRAVGPRQREVLHVPLVDLTQRAVVTARVIAVVGRPRIRRWLAEERGIKLDLRTQPYTREDNHHAYEPRRHGAHGDQFWIPPCSPCLRGCLLYTSDAA